MEELDQSEIIRDAFEKAGGIGAVAKAFEMSEEGVRLWRARGKVPDKHVIELERISGVPRQRLRPDLYCPPAPRQQAAYSGPERRGQQA